MVLEPSGTLRATAQAVCEGVGRFFAARMAGRSTLTVYESHTEAYNLLSMAGRGLESLSELAKIDQVHYVGGVPIARAVFESSIRSMWLLQPENVFVREARYLAHLREEEDLYRREVTILHQLKAETKQLLETRDAIRDFRERVTALLPPGVSVPSTVPTLREILRELGEERKYLYYMQLSQVSHGSHRGAGKYRKHLGAEKILEEDISPADWGFLFAASWYAFAAAAEGLMVRLVPAEEAFGDSAFPERVDGLIRALLDHGSGM